MKPRRHRPLPGEQRALLARAERLEWWSIGTLLGTALLMYLAMGNSQAMKTAWVEDMLSLVPAISFLLAARFARRPPDAVYANGRDRAFDIAFLVSAVALSGVGGWLVVDALLALFRAEHPAIAGVVIRGHYLWQGWLMIAALVVATLAPMIIGHHKLRLARELQLKPLRTDADMNKADWLTAAAGIAGVAGIGLGWWWADAAAALVIAGDILRDGARNLGHAVRDLHDAYPQTLERGDHDPVVERIREAVLALDWVQDCDVRLHEEGLRLCGVLIVDARDGNELPQRLIDARRAAQSVSWRVDDVVATFADVEDDGAVPLA